MRTNFKKRFLSLLTSSVYLSNSIHFIVRKSQSEKIFFNIADYEKFCGIGRVGDGDRGARVNNLPTFIFMFFNVKIARVEKCLGNVVIS